MKAITYPWQEIRPDLALKWLDLRRTNPALDSPYFHPKFTGIIAWARPNVELAVIGDGNGIGAMLPFQRMPGDIGVPAGEHLSDYQGLICAPGFECDPRKLMKQCGLIAWDFDHLLTSQESFEPFHLSIEPSPQIDLSNGFDAYARSHTGLFKAHRNNMRRLERDHGSLHFVPCSADPAAMKQLLAWKSQQYQSTGVRDVLADPWVTSVLHEIHRTQDRDFAGTLSLLYAGDRMVAAHFGMQSRTVWHYWFPAYDPEFAPYSPGTILLLKMAEYAPKSGIGIIDLGKGMFDQKRRLMNALTPVATGSVELLSMRYAKRALRRNLRSLVINMHLDGPARRLYRALRGSSKQP